LICSVQLVMAPSTKRAHTLFLVSNIYLAAVLFMICVNALA
jgi:heme O synthase-like polyprenyltransferase